MTVYSFTDFYTEWFSICPNKTSKYRTKAVFKHLGKQIND
jgi:hypothetical protein